MHIVRQSGGINFFFSAAFLAVFAGQSRRIDEIDSGQCTTMEIPGLDLAGMQGSPIELDLAAKPAAMAGTPQQPWLHTHTHTDAGADCSRIRPSQQMPVFSVS